MGSVGNVECAPNRCQWCGAELVSTFHYFSCPSRPGAPPADPCVAGDPSGIDDRSGDRDDLHQWKPPPGTVSDRPVGRQDSQR